MLDGLKMKKPVSFSFFKGKPCFAQFSTKIYWNIETWLHANFFHMLTQLFKFYTFHSHVSTHFMPLVSFDPPLKTLENQRFSAVFSGYRKRPVAWNGLKSTDDLNKVIHQIDRKWTVTPFRNIYSKIWVGFCLNTGNALSLRFHFNANRRNKFF